MPTYESRTCLCHRLDMAYKLMYPALLSFALSVAARHLTMPAKVVFDALGHKEFGSYFENFDGRKVARSFALFLLY